MTKNTKSGPWTTATSSVDLWCVLVGKIGNLGESWFKNQDQLSWQRSKSYCITLQFFWTFVLPYKVEGHIIRMATEGDRKLFLQDFDTQ